MSRRRLAGLALSMLGSPLACSTLASPEPASVCTNDDQCDKSLGEICGAGTCYASNLPPRAEVALDMTAAGGGSFRLELYGPDQAITRIDTRPARYHVGLDNEDEIAGVRDELRLAVLETYHFGDQDAEVPLRATLYPSQGSRLGIAPPKSVLSLGLDPLDAMGLPVAVLPWAHYDSNDRSPSYTGPGPEPERPLLVQISPKDGLDLNVDVQRGVVYRQLVREQQALSSTHAFNLHTDRDCHRNLYGTARVVGQETDAPSPVPIGVELFHIRRDPAPGPICDPEPAIGTPAVCSPATIARVSDYKPVPCTAKSQCPQPLGCYPTEADDGSRACGCGSDSECPTGQVCELQSHRCALDLASPDIGVAGYGLQASEGVLETDNVDKPGGMVSEFEAWVYTYCEDNLEADREMEFIVRATPNGLNNNLQAPLPQLTFHTSVQFLWDNGDRPRPQLKNMCFPDWKPPQPLTFDVSSAPRELYRDATDQPFVCCAASCLDLANPTPTPPESCRLVATLTARTIFTPDAQLWSDRGCMALDSPDKTLPEGSQRLSFNFDLAACTGGPCDISLSPGNTSLEYELRVEPPPSSLIRSMVVPTVVIDPTTTSLTLPKLEYRVLLRGRVTAEDCGDGSLTIDCPRASILAERLRIPGEEPALSPIFVNTATIPGSNGDFVLAVNPGVYLLTALPASGSPGGPADIRVVDLRLDSKLVDISGPIPIADLDTALALDVGKLVTVELEGFGRSTKAVPFDVGYWANPKPTQNGEPLDLNDPTTCYGSTNRGCQIRRLRANGSFLSLTQESYVKYLARGTESP